MALIYTAEIASVKLNGDKVDVEVKGTGAFANTIYGEKDGKKIATVTAYSADLKPQQTKVYDLSVLAGINTVGDRKSTRLNSSHANISYAVFCLKKKNIRPQIYIA